jgi:hypothetical protein
MIKEVSALPLELSKHWEEGLLTVQTFKILYYILPNNNCLSIHNLSQQLAAVE